MATWDIGVVQREGSATDIGAVQASAVEPPTVGGIMTTNTNYWGALIIVFGSFTKLWEIFLK